MASPVSIPVAVEEHVLGLDVAVHNAVVLVHMLQGNEQLRHVEPRLVLSQARVLLHERVHLCVWTPCNAVQVSARSIWKPRAKVARAILTGRWRRYVLAKDEGRVDDPYHA